MTVKEKGIVKKEIVLDHDVLMDIQNIIEGDNINEKLRTLINNVKIDEK